MELDEWKSANIIETHPMLKKVAAEFLEEIVLLSDRERSSCTWVIHVSFALTLDSQVFISTARTAQQVVFIQDALKIGLQKVSRPLSILEVALSSPPLLILLVTWTLVLCFRVRKDG